MRRVAGILAIAAGVGLIAIALGHSLFDRTDDAERILDRFEFLTLGDNPARYLAEADLTRAGSTELVDEAIPRLASEAGVPPAELEARFPALVAAQEEIPDAHEFSVRYSEQLDAVDEKFQSVYDIPINGLPLTATPWLFLLGGLACVALGVIAAATGSRSAIVAIGVLGLAMVLGPLALSAPGKAADAEDVKDFSDNGLTEQAATAAQEASAALDSVIAEAEEQILPFLAARGGVSPADSDQQLSGGFPAAAELIAQWDQIGPRLSRLADAVSESVDEFDSAEEMPIASPVWFLLGAGIAMSLAAGVALLLGRRRATSE